MKARGDKERLLELIAQGEHEQQDFKYVVMDAAKLAKSVSAFANTHGGWSIAKRTVIIEGTRHQLLVRSHHGAKRFLLPIGNMSSVGQLGFEREAVADWPLISSNDAAIGATCFIVIDT